MYFRSWRNPDPLKSSEEAKAFPLFPTDAPLRKCSCFKPLFYYAGSLENNSLLREKHIECYHRCDTVPDVLGLHADCRCCSQHGWARGQMYPQCHLCCSHVPIDSRCCDEREFQYWRNASRQCRGPNCQPLFHEFLENQPVNPFQFPRLSPNPSPSAIRAGPSALLPSNCGPAFKPLSMSPLSLSHDHFIASRLERPPTKACNGDDQSYGMDKVSY